MAKQKIQLKLLLIDVDEKYNKFFPSFCFFNEEFKSGNCIVDIFPDQFSFHPHLMNIKKYMKNLDKVMFKASSNLSSTIVVLDASIKNQVTTSISHIHSFNKLVIKTLHRAINITTAKVELFAIQYSINQAVANPNVKHIVVITNSLYTTRKILSSSTHLSKLKVVDSNNFHIHFLSFLLDLFLSILFLELGD